MHRHDGRSFQLFFWIVITKSMCDKTASTLFKYVMMGRGVIHHSSHISNQFNLLCFINPALMTLNEKLRKQIIIRRNLFIEKIHIQLL